MNEHDDLFTKQIQHTVTLIAKIQNNNTSRSHNNRTDVPSSHPWTKNREYQRVIKARNQIKTTAGPKPSTFCSELIKLANINVQFVYNKLKDDYYAKVLANLPKDPTDFFALMKTKRQSKKSLPLIMKYSGISYRGNARFDALCQHLSSCFALTSYDFSTNNRDIHLLAEQIHKEHYINVHDDRWQNFFEFTLEEVHASIIHLDEKKDSGPMKICVTYIKYNAAILTPILANIFNTILHTGIVPADWKNPYITPIPKKGNVNNIENYRGIAMQSVIPKLLDMLLTKRLYQHLEFAIPEVQHGFVKGKSTISN